MCREVIMNLNDYIAVIDNYPKKGISFKDITPLVKDPDAFAEACSQLAEFAKSVGANIIVGPEARGFIFGAPTAIMAHMGFVPVRKPNKLPREVITYTYQLEYGTDTLCMHRDAIKKGDKVVIIDDLVAVGGTINAVAHMVEELGGEVAGVGCVIALEGLSGIKELPEKYPFKALLTLTDEVK